MCQELGRVEPSLNSHKVVAFASFACFSLPGESQSHSQPRGIHFASLTFSNLHFLFHCFLGFDVVTCSSLGCVLSPVGPEYSLPLCRSLSGRYHFLSFVFRRAGSP